MQVVQFASHFPTADAEDTGWTRGDVSFCNVYIDDVIVFSSSIQEHVNDLCQVFDCLRKIGLKLHPQNCQFACPEVLYLGHITV